MGSPKRSLLQSSAPFLETVARALIGGLFALPDPLLRALAGPVPAQAAGLEPDAWMVARLAELARLPAGERPVAEMRARFELIAAPFSPRRTFDLATEEHVLAGPGGSLAARLYVPGQAPPRGPLLVYFHGGGWTTGSIDTHDRVCRRFAAVGGVAGDQEQ